MENYTYDCTIVHTIHEILKGSFIQLSCLPVDKADFKFLKMRVHIVSQILEIHIKIKKRKIFCLH